MSSFYQKSFAIDSILEELKNMNLSENQKHHLALLVDTSLYHKILNEILSKLGQEDKNEFLFLLHQDSQDNEVLNFLRSKIENVEEEVKKIAKELIKEIHKEIKEAKKQ